MRYTVFDIEADELLDEITLVHCFSYRTFEDGTLVDAGSFTDLSLIQPFCNRQEVMIGHEIKRYDVPALKKVLGVEITCRLIDTLALSWYLYPGGIKKKHGLDDWGTYFGIPKPPISDWKNLPKEIYVHRCEEDVKINSALFHKCIEYLLEIYDYQNIDDIMDYLTYKMDCAYEQWANPLRVNVPYCHEMLAVLHPLVEEKINALKPHMPKIIKMEKKTIPAKPYKQDGQLSATGIKWMKLLFEHGFNADYTGVVEVVKCEEEPKPTSVAQLKPWLFSLGWQPTIFKYETKNGVQKATPQLSDKEGNICRNIKLLSETYPYLSHLEGLFMLRHRVGVFQGFIDSANEAGYMRAEIQGFTNTLRFKHKKPIANLPAVHKPYGKEIRGAIMVPSEDHVFCGSDMASLEDSTKRHYMFFYDPEYVEEMSDPDFDPHLDIAVQGKMLTLEQVQAHKDKKEDHSKIRKDAKQVNFSAVYGVGAPKMALGTGWTLEKCNNLLSAYWKRNWSVKKIAEDTLWKQIGNQMWLYNPVSNFWYPLRYQKDKFSTLNQGTGVYCFDTWVRNVRRKGITINLQYHDEIGFHFLRSNQEYVTNSLKEAIKETNQQIQLNVQLGISIDFGNNYAECH